MRLMLDRREGRICVFLDDDGKEYYLEPPSDIKLSDGDIFEYDGEKLARMGDESERTKNENKERLGALFGRSKTKKGDVKK